MGVGYQSIHTYIYPFLAAPSVISSEGVILHWFYKTYFVRIKDI